MWRWCWAVVLVVSWWCVGNSSGASNVASDGATFFSHVCPLWSWTHGFVARHCSRLCSHWNNPRQLHGPTLPRANLRKWHGSSYGNSKRFGEQKAFKTHKAALRQRSSGVLLKLDSGCSKMFFDASETGRSSIVWWAYQVPKRNKCGIHPNYLHVPTEARTEKTRLVGMANKNKGTSILSSWA